MKSLISICGCEEWYQGSVVSWIWDDGPRLSWVLWKFGRVEVGHFVLKKDSLSWNSGCGALSRRYSP